MKFKEMFGGYSLVTEFGLLRWFPTIGEAIAFTLNFEV